MRKRIGIVANLTASGVTWVAVDGVMSGGKGIVGLIDTDGTIHFRFEQGRERVWLKDSSTQGILSLSSVSHENVEIVPK